MGLSIHLAYCLAAFFSIVAPTVYALQATLVLEDPRRIVEVKATLLQRSPALCLVPFQYHMGGIAV